MEKKTLGKPYEYWKYYLGFCYRRKKVGDYIVELIASKYRGGFVTLWYSGDDISRYDKERILYNGKRYIFQLELSFKRIKDAKIKYDSIKTIVGIKQVYEELA